VLAKSVIPECNIDSNLFDVLLNFGKKGVNHTKGNNTVVRKIQEKFEDMFCLGVIDQDKENLKFIDERCHEIKITGVTDYFKLFKERDRPHYIIQIVPEVETWIIKVVNNLKIDLEYFGINAKNVIELARITKKVTAKDDQRFRALFKEIVRKSEETNFEPVLKLRTIANLILEKNYDLDINELINA
jgi:hypothetical protein